MYEHVRFVDPLAKHVINHSNNIPNTVAAKCFDFWGRNKICDNCISMRAYNQNQTFVKIEYTPSSIHMVTAIPIELNNRRVVLELLKDITSSMVLDGQQREEGSQIYSLIDSINNLAFKDDLTGIFNRRYINEKLPVDLSNATLLNQDLAVIMADIDFFKRVNDNYGHLNGDCVLKRFAATLQSCLQRETDWLARYGGEEFLICLPGANLSRAVAMAESMRTAVESLVVGCSEHQITITASFGVYSLEDSQNYPTIDTVLNEADQRLYKAKNNGRNRVEYQ